MKVLSIIAIFLLYIPNEIYAQLDFQDPIFVENQLTPSQLTVNDFDGNGLNDIAYVTQDDGKLFVLYNQGSYSFTELSISFSAGKAYQFPITSADFNKDGLYDIAIFDETSPNQLVILLSEGITFKLSRINVGVNISVNQITTMDFNADGNIDIMLPRLGVPLTIVLGDGIGGFSLSTLTDITDGGRHAVVSDLDKDGKLDIAVASLDKIEIYLKNDASGYTKTVKNKSGFSLNLICTDVSGDGYPDLIASWYEYGLNQPYLLYIENDETGTFDSESIIPDAFPFVGLDHFDFNNDAREDLVVGSTSNSSALQILKNTGNSNLQFQSPTSNLSKSIIDLKTSDIDDDGIKEIISISSTGTLNIFRNNLNKFQLDFWKILGAKPNSGKVVDLNLDGHLDIVGSGVTNASVAVLYGNGDFTFNPPKYFKAKGDVHAVETGDFNSDGFLDILYSANDNSAPQTKEIILILSNGSGNLTDEVLVASTGSFALAAGDFNQDGNMDFVSDQHVFFGNGLGNFTSLAINATPNSIFTITTGYFDDDTYLDIAFNDNTNTYIGLNNGSGNFPTFTKIISTSSFFKTKSINYNGDMLSDLISLSNDNASIKILINIGDGQFNELSVETPTGTLYGFATAIDFDNDGDQDIVSGFSENSLLGIGVFNQLSTNNFTLSHKIDFRTSIPDYLIGADFNDDQKTDILALKMNGDPFVIVPNDAVFEPSINASQLSVTMRTDKSAKISFTKGNGSGRIVIVRESSNGAGTPVDGSFYASNTKFGVGYELGNKNYVVYRNSGESVEVTDLKANTEYVASVYEFSSNQKNTLINYLTNTVNEVTFRTKQTQVITFPVITTKVMGGADFELTATASSNLPISYSIVNGNNIQLIGTTVKLQGPGPVTIKASQPGDENFLEATDVMVTFCVNPIKPIITYEAIADKYRITSSSSSNNSWLKNGEILAGEVNQTIDVLANGEYSVKVDYSGCFDTSNPIKNQTISFPEISSKDEGQAEFSISATTTSGLDMVFEVVTGGITITNNKVAILSPGPAILKASQPGNESYFPATPVTQSFCVNPKKPAISISFSSSGQFLLTSSSSLNNNWYLNGAIIPNATNPTYEPIQSGVYLVQVNYSGCSNSSLPTVNIITGLDDTNEYLEIYPNPTVDALNLIKSPTIEVTDVTLLDHNGNKIESTTYNLATGVIDMQELPSGQYTLIINSTKNVITKKIVKL